MKLKRLAGIGLALIVVVSGFSVSFGAESSNVISQWTVTTENAQAKDTYAAVLTDTDVSAYDASYIGYAVEGGYIYYYSDGEIADASKSVTNVVIPDEIGGVKITSIGLGAFEGCSSLTSITIPDSVKSIGTYAFRECSSLTGITLPNSVTSIGKGAFMGCSSLTDITIPDSVISIGTYAFRECISLTGITLPNSITSIGDGAFEYCSSLTGITLPNGITGIEDYTFMGCSGLTGITIPDGVTSIGDSVFMGCSSLTGITIPNGVTSIGVYAFDGCENLTIYCQPGSYAEIYAKENNITYENFLLGDADDSKILSANDAATILQKVLNSVYIMPFEEKTSDYMPYLDVDGSGTLTANDSAVILQKVLNSSYKFPVQG